MIYLVGNAPSSAKYVPTRFHDWASWMYTRKEYQLDIETTVTKWWCDKQIITVQFGDVDGKEQWVLQWSKLDVTQRACIQAILEDKNTTKLIHNAAFECIVCLFHGIRIRGVYDTMLAEQIITCGLEVRGSEEEEEDETDEAGGFYSLTELCYRYLGHHISKAEQLNFGDDILTESKVIYAAGDVTKLGFIRRMQMPVISQWDLEYVAALEMEAVLGYAEMTWRGMPLDKDQWLAQLELALPVQMEARRKLDEELINKDNPFWRKATEMGFYDPQDRLKLNLKTNHNQKKAIVERFFPFLKDRCGKPAIAYLWEKKRDSIPEPAQEWVQAFYDEDWQKIINAGVQTDRQWFIDQGYLIPGGSVTINWNAWQQTLPIFQCYNKRLKSTGKKDMGTFFHPIGAMFKEYKDALKLTSTYGQKFIDEHVEPDGVVRTTFNQILSTGRVSSRRPNMQQIPVREPIGVRYRNCFISHDPDWVYVSSDLMSAELCIIAYMSGEKVWLDALKKRQDLHSVCAEVIFGKEWLAGKEEGCAYYEKMWYNSNDQTWSQVPPNDDSFEQLKKQGFTYEPRRAKCKCKKHKVSREPTKTIDFGAAYGMSEYKLAGDMRWSTDRARGVLKDYFAKFNGIGGMLDYLGRFGVTRGWIQTIAPFFRIRWFPHWTDNKAGIDAHLRDIKRDSRLAEIERASKNMPIQGSQADIAKLSLVMLYWKIHDELMIEDKVHLVCQVHDANDTRCHKDYADTWSPIVTQVMEEASLYVIPNGLLRSETSITPVWSK